MFLLLVAGMRTGVLAVSLLAEESISTKLVAPLYTLMVLMVA